MSLSDSSPAQVGLEFYGDDFYDILDLHLMFGYVSSTPEYFYMARPVHKDASYEDLITISKTYTEDKQNCWCVYFVAGNMEKAFDNIPFDLPYCVFEHKGIVKLYLLEKLKHRIRKYYGIRRKAKNAATPTAPSPSG